MPRPRTCVLRHRGPCLCDSFRLAADLEISGLSDRDLRNPPFMPDELVGLPYPRNRPISDSSSLDRANGKSRDLAKLCFAPEAVLAPAQKMTYVQGRPRASAPTKRARARAIGRPSSMWANAGMRRPKRPPSTYTLFLERLSQRDTGCKNCYAEGMVKRLQAMGTPGYENWFALKMLPSRLEDPVKRRKPDDLFREFNVGLVPRADPGRVRQHPKVHCADLPLARSPCECYVRLSSADAPLSYRLHARKIIAIGARLD